MSEIGEKIVQVALTFIGTPFQHQGHTKGVGVDCAGFVAEVAKEAGAVPDAKFEQRYRRRESGDLMLDLLNNYMQPVPSLEEARLGDVLALCDERLRQPDVPRHLIFVSQLEPYLKGVHASQHGVVNHRLSLPFVRRIHSIWRIKGSEEASKV